ncbi:BatA domain-containing protein [Ekhidna sp.]
MSFWWYFIPFLIVPILVHLFDFRKAKKLYFSSVKYLTSLTSKTKAQSRLKYFLILSTRLLLFACIVSLVALLLSNSKYSRNQEGIVVAYYDNSLSSILNDSDNKVRLGLDNLSKKESSILYIDNTNRSLLSTETGLSLPSNKSAIGVALNVMVPRLNDLDAGSHYIFSDLQMTELESMRNLFLDTTKKYHLILTNDLNDISNVIIDSLYLIPNQENFKELSIMVDFEISNMTNGNVVVKLMQGERQLSSIVKDITELNGVRFDIPKEVTGSFEIVIDGDNVLYDNVFHFNLDKRIKPKVAIVQSSSSFPIEEVFQNKSLFEVVTLDANNLDYELMDDSDLIIISGQNKLPGNLLNEFENSTFLLFGNDIVDVQSYSDFLGLVLGDIESNIREITVDTNHPLLKGVFERSLNDGKMPKNEATFEIGGDFEPIISYRGGIPFLLKKNNVYFFNTSLNKESGGFQSNALFLPILYKIAFTSSGNIEVPYYFPGDRIVTTANISDNPIKLKNENYEVIPVFNTNGAQVMLELPSDINAGKYVLIQDEDTLHHISVNIPKSESIMDAPSFEDVQSTLAGSKNVTVSRIMSNGDNSAIQQDSKSSLWKYALILALLLILIETVLHRYLR